MSFFLNNLKYSPIYVLCRKPTGEKKIKAYSCKIHENGTDAKVHMVLLRIASSADFSPQKFIYNLESMAKLRVVCVCEIMCKNVWYLFPREEVTNFITKSSREPETPENHFSTNSPWLQKHSLGHSTYLFPANYHISNSTPHLYTPNLCNQVPAVQPSLSYPLTLSTQHLNQTSKSSHHNIVPPGSVTAINIRPGSQARE